MSSVMQDEPFNPQRIFDELMERCKKAKLWEVSCIVEDWWSGPAPFSIRIEDGVFHCYVIALNKRDAFIQVANSLPVVVFLSKQDE